MMENAARMPLAPSPSPSNTSIVHDSTPSSPSQQRRRHNPRALLVTACPAAVASRPPLPRRPSWDRSSTITTDYHGRLPSPSGTSEATLSRRQTWAVAAKASVHCRQLSLPPSHLLRIALAKRPIAAPRYLQRPSSHQGGLLGRVRHPQTPLFPQGGLLGRVRHPGLGGGGSAARRWRPPHRARPRREAQV